ncbi:hypothetical protein [Bosea sp. BK604]|uniref:hypothetical protein n=1 Tax=Bosea sp. BK604 TaxID=2512180 RepID=UPI0010525125|nr:hypothetical protein [Bosea sp. BK604]TCR70585.1 hypothetical protein EV560_101993 [Bosea sp. BK604]
MQVPSKRLAVALFACVVSVQAPLAQSRDDPKMMISLWGQANGQCRGGSGNDPKTFAACDQRDAYGQRLAQLGWCYGKKGGLGYQMSWHRCTASSLRPGAR